VSQDRDFEKVSSEFEDVYEADAGAEHPAEVFNAELLEVAVEILAPPVPICVPPSTLLSEAIAGMAERNHGCVLVAEDGVLLGIFTERDVVRRVVGKLDPAKTPIHEAMTKDPEAVLFADTIATVLNKMTVGGFRHVPLVDMNRRPVGIVSVKDLVEYFVERFPRHILNVAPDPTIRKPDEIAGAG
jgi:CBS domain-containing protein